MIRVALIALLLAGCAGTPPKERIVVQKVSVPVPEPCPKDFPARPAPPSREAMLETTPEERLKMLGAAYLLLDPWSDKADAALKACRGAR